MKQYYKLKKQNPKNHKTHKIVQHMQKKKKTMTRGQI